MTHLIRRRSLLLTTAALGLSACGGDETAPTVTLAPVSSPSPSPSPSPTPSPTPTASASDDEFVLLEDIKYGNGATASGDIDLLLDIYQPEAECTGPRPTIFYVHGGAFRFGDKQDDLVEALVPRITAEGFNFVSINYRLEGDDPIVSAAFAAVGQSLAEDGLADPDGELFDAIFASLEDGVTALNWMEDNASEYCLDMSRLGYWGSSAGTFVTLQIAYGVNQFDIERPEPRFVNAWWGELFRIDDLEVGEAPFLILHGDQDVVAPYENSVELAAQAETVAVPFAFYTLVGTGHGFDVSKEEQTRTGLDVSVEFAVEHLTGGTPVYGRFDIPE